MIALLTGTLVERSPQALILDVGGVGYHVLASLETYQNLPPIGETTTLHIHTHVREDDIILFGFSNVTEKQLFQRLIRISGVGPRLALNLLSGLPTDQLIDALSTEDLLRITAIPGIGKKTAERIILDMKDKLLDLHGISPVSGDTTPRGENLLYDDLISVLVNLGYKRHVAEKALRQLSFDSGTTLQEAVRQTLKQLGNGASKPGASS